MYATNIEKYLSWRIHIDTLFWWYGTLVMYGHYCTVLIAVPYVTVAIMVCLIVDY